MDLAAQLSGFPGLGSFRSGSLGPASPPAGGGGGGGGAGGGGSRCAQRRGAGCEAMHGLRKRSRALRSVLHRDVPHRAHPPIRVTHAQRGPHTLGARRKRNAAHKKSCNCKNSRCLKL